METRDFIEVLGWATAISFGLSVLNFFIKYANKKYISKLGKEKSQIVNLYRKIMKLTIKNHKLTGGTAIAAVIAHFFIAFSNNNISITGIASALLMTTVIVFGIYGAVMNKNHKGNWLKIHRVLAFATILAIAIHLI